MKNQLSGIFTAIISTFVSGISVADETVFSVGETSSSESFSRGEGIFFFAAAILGIAAIHGMLLYSRSVHRRIETELGEVERLIEENPS